MREAEKMANERGGKFWGSDDVGAASRGVAPWRRGVAIGRHFTLNFIQAFHSGTWHLRRTCARKLKNVREPRTRSGSVLGIDVTFEESLGRIPEEG